VATIESGKECDYSADHSERCPPTAACLLPLPAVLANQRHKTGKGHVLRSSPGFRLNHAHKYLRLARPADRNYQTATDLQLRDSTVRELSAHLLLPEFHHTDRERSNRVCRQKL